jgi:hypothetical protein
VKLLEGALALGVAAAAITAATVTAPAIAAAGISAAATAPGLIAGLRHAATPAMVGAVFAIARGQANFEIVQLIPLLVGSLAVGDCK